MANDTNGREPDRGTRLILGELRDLRREAAADRRRSDERFETVLREFRADSMRRDAAMRAALRNVTTVGLAIVRAINRNTSVLESHGQVLRRIDRNTGGRRNGPPPPGNGRRG